jgi:hypothetical protein
MLVVIGYPDERTCRHRKNTYSRKGLEALMFMAHPGIVWLESCGPRSGGRVKVQTAAMEVDRVAEA